MGKKTFLKASLVCLGVLLLGIIIDNGIVNAKFSSKKACLNASGGRKDIASVDWACGKEQSNGANSCALWIGGSDSKDTTIKVDTQKTSGKISIKFWGMCTQAKNRTSRIWVNEDNGSINDSGNLNRGKWAHPTSKNTTLDIAKFIKGAGKCPSSKWDGKICKHEIKVGGKIYTEYKRKVQVCRRNGAASSCKSWSTACSCMRQTIKLRILKGGYLTVQEKNIYSNHNLNKWSAGYGSGWVTASKKGKSGNKFIGWKVTKDHAVKGVDYLITRTSKKVDSKTYTTYLDSDSISSANVIYYNDNGKEKRIYSKLHANLSGGNKTVWAYYAPICKLTIKAKKGTTITVERTGGFYAKHQMMSDGGNIYRGDKLKITATNYKKLYLKSATKGTVEWESGKTYKVSGKTNDKCENVKISTELDEPIVDPVGSGAAIEMMVKNEDVDDYNDYLKEIYAKPSDNLDFRAKYNPLVQENYSKKADVIRVDGKIVNHGDQITVGPAWPSWNNAFGTLASWSGGWNNWFIFTKGSKTEQEKHSAYVVKGDDVGKDLEEKALTNHYANTKITPKSVDFPYKTYPSSVTVSYSGSGYTPKSISISGIGSVSCWSGTSSSITVQYSCLSGTGGTRSLTIYGEKKEKDKNGKEVITTKTFSTSIYLDPEVLLVGSGKKLEALIDTTAIEDSAHTYVPYNFETWVQIPNDEEEIVYAGEGASVAYSFGLDEKSNDVTDGTYVTKADQVKRQLIMYRDDFESIESEGGKLDEAGRNANICSQFYGIDDSEDCWVQNEMTSTVQPSASGLTSYPFNMVDWNAGSRLCVSVAVFPADSGRDDNWNDLDYKDKDGNSAWQVSNSKCYKLAKKPSLQVWGSGVYSKGNIKTALANKKIVAGYTGGRVFGSWGELGVIASGTVQGFGSGASLGYQSSSNGETWPNYRPEDGDGNNDSISNGGPGGATTTSFCILSPLTFANQSCNSGTAGGVGSTSATNTMKIDKKAVLDSLFAGDSTNTSCSSNATDISDPGTYCYYSDDNLTLGSVIIDIEEGDGNPEIVDYDFDDDINNAEEWTGDDDEEEGETWDDDSVISGGNNDSGNGVVITEAGLSEVGGAIKRVHSTKNVIIKGNLKYSDSAYQSFSQIPKIVVYAEGDIEIDCAVEQIDALLIANGTVKTCADSDDLNSKSNSRQLTIFGAVIANALEPRRTYGAATGANSIVPAEIINFDPSLYLWNRVSGEGEGAITGGLEAAYTVEISPRQ
ncbi:hypothetical protein IKF20_01765 [Candidatus Saccharibacteria bacterium]|nr:hypothetical protein [Candidatus Saccharibacteria bacterium]